MSRFEETELATMHDMEKTDITQVIQKPSLKIRRKYAGVPQLRLFVHIYVESTQSVRPPDGSVIIRIHPSNNFKSQHSRQIKQRGMRRKACRHEDPSAKIVCTHLRRINTKCQTARRKCHH